nr:AAA family ATPase [Glycomyces amatae]
MNEPAEPGATYTARCVLHSATGGTGRTTAAVMLARHLAGQGRQVLLVDLDVRSPGGRLMLGPGAALPRYGVLDAMEGSAAATADLVAPSAYTPGEGTGAIWVAPARGSNRPQHSSSLVAPRIDRLAAALNACNAAVAEASGRYPDVVLIDAPTGIDPLADTALCDVSDFAFLFAADTADTWDTYRDWFTSLLTSGQAPAMREQLRVVAAMAPGIGPNVAVRRQSLRERAWDAFSILYDDDIPDPVTGRLDPNVFHPPLDDEAAPHYPLEILLLPSLIGLDTAGVAGWHEGRFVEAAFDGFVAAAGPLVTALLPERQPS